MGCMKRWWLWPGIAKNVQADQKRHILSPDRDPKQQLFLTLFLSLFLHFSFPTMSLFVPNNVTFRSQLCQFYLFVTFYFVYVRKTNLTLKQFRILFVMKNWVNICEILILVYFDCQRKNLSDITVITVSAVYNAVNKIFNSSLLLWFVRNVTFWSAWMKNSICHTEQKGVFLTTVVKTSSDCVALRFAELRSILERFHHLGQKHTFLFLVT